VYGFSARYKARTMIVNDYTVYGFIGRSEGGHVDSVWQLIGNGYTVYVTYLLRVYKC
jgi:hypothetical protein